VRETWCEEEETWSPNPTDLFRFSAATFNSHRIHYDAPYAINTEGYPGLLHGPFTAAKLFVFAQRQAQASISEFTCRATAPLFVNQPVRLTGGGGLDEFNAIRCDGIVAMTGRVKFSG
jgi:3-methylfumaryl-CoA hydratase